MWSFVQLFRCFSPCFLAYHSPWPQTFTRAWRCWGEPRKSTSASSSLDFWVKSFQLHAGIFDAELPIDTALFGVRLVGPGSNFRVQRSHFTDATSTEALARQAAQLAFRDIQPAAVFWGVAKFDPF